MRRFLCCCICIVLILSFVGCNFNDNTPMLSGSYYAVGDYEEMLTPYIALSIEEKEFRMGAGSILSFEAYGSFKVKDDKLVAASQIATFVFEIKNSKTLVLIDNGDNEYFKMPVGTEFLFSEDSK